MRRLPIAAAVGLLALGGCSYTFDVKAVMIDGRLAFVADGPSGGRAKCVSGVQVLPVEFARAAEGEGVEAWRQRTYAWADQDGYDCDDRLPVFYGQALKGEDPEHPEPVLRDVAPKALEVGVTYDVLITSEAIGYGGGRFRLLADGTVENLGPAMLMGEDGPA